MKATIADTGSFTKSGNDWNSVRNAAIADILDDGVLNILSEKTPTGDCRIKRAMIVFNTTPYTTITTANLTIPFSLVQGSTTGVTIQLFNFDPNQNLLIAFGNQWKDHFNYPIPFSADTRIDFNGTYTIPLTQYAINQINQNPFLHVAIVEKDYDYINITPPNGTKVGVDSQDITQVFLEVSGGDVDKPISLDNWGEINTININNVEKINI